RTRLTLWWPRSGRRDDHEHRAALEHRRPLDDRAVLQVLGDLLEDLTAELRVGQLAPAEPDRDLDLVAFLEEALDRLDLGEDIVLVGPGGHPDLLQIDDLLVLPSLALFLGLLVLEPPVVHQPADWRYRGRGDLDQVQPPLLRRPQRLKGRKNPELLALFPDQADFPDTDTVVYTQ